MGKKKKNNTVEPSTSLETPVISGSAKILALAELIFLVLPNDGRSLTSHPDRSSQLPLQVWHRHLFCYFLEHTYFSFEAGIS